MTYDIHQARADAAYDAQRHKTISIDEEILPGIAVMCRATLEENAYGSPVMVSLDDLYASVIITDSHDEQHDLCLKDGHPLAKLLWDEIEDAAHGIWQSLEGHEQWD